jgi:N-methylhydantoinase A/oxoprolinase/acetone carboxylase beta subunit
MPSDLRLGVDVGGTHTDAVVLGSGDRLVARIKVQTTTDVRDGIARAVAGVLRAAAIEPHDIRSAMLGSTHATNALLERRGLCRVAVIRIGAPLTDAIPPLETWPADLRSVVSAGETIVRGGVEYDGKDLAVFDHDEVRRFLVTVAGKVDGVAVTGVFSPVAPDQELAVAEIAAAELDDVHVSLSHEIGSFGLLPRENATVLNSALGRAALELVSAFEGALRGHGVTAETFFAQNDGTLMAVEYALRFPVLTIGSGPANSMRGAAHLSAVSDALVADVGGTTTEVGALVNGFPRESGVPTVLGGVQTNFRMPDVLSLPIGGGSILALNSSSPEIGPESVGFRLTSEALVFGGRTPTLTDAGVAAGRLRLGTHDLTIPRRRRLCPVLARMDERLADALDRVRAGPESAPLVVVGGGGHLVPDDIPGVREVVRPEDFDVANAIGATIAPVSGQADRICPNRPDRRNAASAEACESAIARAVHAGANPDMVQIVELDEVPFTYLLDPAVWIRAKAVGPIALRQGASDLGSAELAAPTPLTAPR